jgi:hypothetical protein
MDLVQHSRKLATMSVVALLKIWDNCSTQESRVPLVYGDRDAARSWIRGEAISLAVQYSKMEQFARAGYANVSINSSYVSGLV